jgi:hypothetical protein
MGQRVWGLPLIRGPALIYPRPKDVQNLSQSVREMDGGQLPQAVADIPWGHNKELIFSSQVQSSD